MIFQEKPTLHSSVLVEEILSVFSKTSSAFFLDCTFGRGGHSQALLKAFQGARVLALDRDGEAIAYGLKNLAPLFKGRLKLLRTNFHNFRTSSFFDGILMDLGVSSPQLDQAGRGFSFYRKGPLDMRMDQSQSLKAGDIVNGASKEELTSLFKDYGEIVNPHPVITDLLKERKKKKIEGTEELVKMILKHTPWFGGKTHPATPYFLALRMKVNNELEGLKSGLSSLKDLLKPGGKLAVVSFHSLEDRIVKKTFKDFVTEKEGGLWNKKLIRPSLGERKLNPRSRSAGLRVFVRGTEV